tara:strand:+ start:245 stop:859 length:615 start_codon:yes stop_codon:yes gene_type:complete
MAAVTTKLQAVNTMLTTIGEATVTTLTSPPYEVSRAIDILEETIRETLQDSFIFNTEEDVTLSKNGDNKVPVTAKAYVQVRTKEEEYVIRNGFLYSMKDKTDVLGKDVTAATVVYLLDFEDLPEAAKRYCTVRGARVFADRFVGSKEIRTFTAADEIEAKAKLMDYQHQVDRVNMLDDSAFSSSITNRLHRHNVAGVSNPRRLN